MNTKKKFDIMNYFNVIRTVIAMVIALLIVFAIIFFVSEEPVFAIQKLMLGPLQTKRSFFNVIERAVPLIFTGLSLNIVLRSGIFNIGADGAFYMGAVIATAIAIRVPLPNILHQFVLIVAAAIAGGFISMLPVLINKFTKVDPTVLGVLLSGPVHHQCFLPGGNRKLGQRQVPQGCQAGQPDQGNEHELRFPHPHRSRYFRCGADGEDFLRL